MIADPSSRPAQVVEWHGRQLWIRPIARRDRLEHGAFFAALRPAMSRVVTLTRLEGLVTGGIAALARPPTDREHAFIATIEGGAQSDVPLGVVRAATDPCNGTAEFVLLLGERSKGRGLGRLLLGKLVDSCRQSGTGQLVSEAASDDEPLIELARAFDFDVRCSHVVGVLRLALALRAAPRH
jgi:acetyltransferase